MSSPVSPWSQVLQISVEKKVLKWASVNYLCRIIGDGALCGACDRGIIRRAKVGEKCKVCSARVRQVIVR